jgi:oligosaccharide repeat unit polymerase
MRKILDNALLAVAGSSTVFSLLSYAISLFSSVITSNLLLGSIVIVTISIFTSKTKLPFYSPTFFFPLIFLIILLLGVFSFQFIYGRPLIAEMTEYLYVAFLGLFIGLVIGQKGTDIFIKRQLSPAHATSNVTVLYLIALAGFIAFFAMIFVRGIPILAGDINSARSTFYSGLGHFNIVYSALPIVSIALLADGLIRGDRKRIQIAHFIFLLVLLSNAMTGFRSLVLKNIISYIFFMGIFHAIRIPKSMVLSYSVAAIIMASVFGAFRRGNEGLSGVINEMGITIGARAKAAELIFIKIETAAELNFSYFGDLYKLLPGSQNGQNVELKFLIFDNASIMAEKGGINPSIVGEALLYGKDYMVFLAPFLLGLFAAVLFGLAVRRTSNLFWPVLYAVLISDLIGATASGIATRLPSLLIQLILVFFVMVLYKYRFVLSKKNFRLGSGLITRI